MSEGVVFMDNKFIHPKDAKMSIFDAGFVWGDVVYDVTSSWNGWVFMLDEHLVRFQQSINGFRLDNPYSLEEMRQVCGECLKRSNLKNAYIKVQLSRGILKDHTKGPQESECKFVAYVVPYMWIWGKDKCLNGANLFVSSVERISSRAIDQRFKNYDRADLVQSRFEAYDHGCDDSILCGPDGNLTEGPGYNLFVVTGGRVLTPDTNILEGVTRGTVSELCNEENISYRECKIHPDELSDADEVFCSTTAGGIMPVTHLNSVPIGNGHKGLLTTRLQELYWAKREKGWRGTRASEIVPD